MRKDVHAGNVVVLDEKNPHTRNKRDGTVIKRHVNSGVYTMDTWACLDETGPVFSWQGQGVARVSTNKPVRPRTKCSSETEEIHAEQKLNDLEEGEDAMTDEKGGGVEREREAGRARSNTHTPFRDWRTRCMMGRGPHSSPRVEKKK